MPVARDPVAKGSGAPEALLGLVAAFLAQTRPRGAPPPVALDSRLDRDLGIDSLARMELLLRIEREFDVRLPERLVNEARTPRDLLRALLAGTPGAAEALEPTPLPAAAAEVRPAGGDTLVEALDFHATHHPERVHIVVLPEDAAGSGEAITYAQLRDEAREVAAGIAAAGIRPGDTVALMLPTSRDFFRAFMGTMLAGAIPVPLYPPAGTAGIAEHLRRQARILENCGASLLVGFDAARTATRMLRALVPSLRRVAGVGELRGAAAAPAVPAPVPADVALIQYTSGSTGDPKGVVLTHANVLANIRAMGAAVGAGPRDVFVSWLPLYHDMGLIGAWLGGLVFAYPLVVMPPTAFVNRPARWLAAMHRFRGTITSAPNFAYEICATRVGERDVEGLDLSAWRLAFNGAEPVLAGTLERFAARYAPRGFRREAFMPVYGLAECSVGLAFPPPGRGPRVDLVEPEALEADGEARPSPPGATEVRSFVACGSPLPAHEIRIVGADGRELPARHEGRIEFRGPSATSGYFRDPVRSAQLLRGGWLDSGDVGYMAGGELFVTSRAKDLIIRGGQHVHPYELEAALGEVEGVRRGCVAVFGVPDAASGTEKVVALVETRLARGEEREALRERVAAAALAVLGAPADDVRIVPPHTVPKTPSGKIRRSACRDIYLRGDAGPRRGIPVAARFASQLARAAAKRAVRSSLQAAYGGWAWSAGIALGLAAAMVSLLPPSRARWRMLRGLARMLLRASGMAASVEGLEHIPAAGPVVLVCNHASYLDGPLLFALLPRPMAFVTKRELAASVVLSRVLRAAGVRYVERFDAARGVEDTRELVEHARAGASLVFFAEGTFTRAPGLMPFHLGAFVTAARAGVPVVPVTLRGTRDILREGRWRPSRAALAVRFGAPRRARGDDWAAAIELRDAVRDEILAHCGEPDLQGRIAAPLPSTPALARAGNGKIPA